jgi:hypothetical protein
MSDKLKELLEAAHAVLPYLRASTDGLSARAEVAEFARRRGTLSEGERLRLEADEADKKDAAIIRFREALVNIAAQGSSDEKR